VFGLILQSTKYKDEFYHKNFALKRAKKNLNAEEIKRFYREYDEMKKLKSPYVVEVYSYLNNNEYTMEYLDCSLSNYIKKNNQKLSHSEKRNLINQVLKAFKYLHSKGLLHRDISPSNILLKIYEDVVVVKIADFGLVKVPNSQLTNLNTELKGSFNDSGLVTEGFQNYDILHETYALTKLIFFIITGKTNVSNIKNPSLKQFVQKGLSADKSKRYQSVSELNIAVTALKE
jgi:serine/threonine protein kinase